MCKITDKYSEELVYNNIIIMKLKSDAAYYA